jgi:hypothetical protein
VHTDIMKTQALLEGLTKYGFDAAYGGALQGFQTQPPLHE